ncbi:MAG: ATP-dependent helicase HrpB [Magnetospirillum sp. WYHS-4]
MDISPLPVAEVLSRLRQVLREGRAAVLEAPPGAGKTTLVPLALLDEPWRGDGTILVLEPRRLAAKAAARRMAALKGETPGETVGFRVRLESAVGPRTRIEVVTEGILTRRLLDDPSLEGVAAVIFDEFHERSIQADLGLALCLEVQAALRDDLRLVVMSATLDGAAVARLMGGVAEIRCEGRMHPVAVHHLDRPATRNLEGAMATAVRQALRDEMGSLLAFLPGEREIRRVQALLEEGDLPEGVRIAPLYGALSPAEQDAAIRPAADGVRKVVLATDIAETSLTIEGVRVVIDGGLRRAPRFDPRSGLSRLETVRISKASAEQRRGRAGRLEPGICFRLWPAAEQAALAPFDRPEILDADLAPLALDLARWGAANPGGLAWLDPPPAAAFAQARDLLADLEALDGDGRLTSQGESMAGMAVHPRLAHMVLAGKEKGMGGLACDLAALLEERDILAGGRDADLRHRLEVLHGEGRAEVHRGALQRARAASEVWRGRLRIDGRSTGCADAAGGLLALAFPDRLAQRRPGGIGRFLMRNGRGARLSETDPLAAADWLAVADVDAAGPEGRIFLAAPLALTEVEDLFGPDIGEEAVVEWDVREEAVLSRRRRRLGALVLDEGPWDRAPKDRIAAAMAEGVGQLGIDVLPWTPELRQWQARVALMRRLDHGGKGWPDISDVALATGVGVWLPPFLEGIARRSQLGRLDLRAALESLLPWDLRSLLDDAAPSHLTVPTGSRILLDYTADGGPVLAVRLQEMLGQADTPRVAGGAVPVLLHLLSPAGRPLQATRDLAGFWKGSYAAVKAEMKGRYPKHPWPDDPLAAAPTRLTKRRMAHNATRPRH